MAESVIIVLTGVFIASLSQMVLKWAAMRQYSRWWQAYLNVYVIGAYAGLLVSCLMFLRAYRVLPLSMGVILETTSYFYVALFGRIFFGERLTWRKLLGLGLIVSGICVYAVSV